MKKIFAASLILFAIISLAFQNYDSLNKITTPSVVEVQNDVNDTLDLDDEMDRLEAEMKIWENKMKPLESEMKAWEAKMKPFQDEMKQWEEKMKPYEKQMKDLERKLKYEATTETERRKITDEMSAIGEKMSTVGEEMSKIGEKMGVVGNEMGKTGEKMGAIGNEMGIVGNKMGIIGEKMGERHRKIFSWFFQELKREGILKEDNVSILMEKGVLLVNGQVMNENVFTKYKKGIEERLAKSLKPDFSFYFKGKISNLTDNSFDFQGNMSSHY